MSLLRRKYNIKALVINKVKITQVIIDPDYEVRHGSYLDDHLILKLVEQLNGREEFPEITRGEYSYFATLVEYGDKKYRLIWLLENGAIYIGVVNAYRDRKRRKL